MLDLREVLPGRQVVVYNYKCWMHGLKEDGPTAQLIFAASPSKAASFWADRVGIDRAGQQVRVCVRHERHEKIRTYLVEVKRTIRPCS